MRQPKMFCVIGEPGSGKTERLINLIKMRVKNGDRAIIVDPEGAEDAWSQFVRVKDAENLKNHTDFKGAVVVGWEKGHTFKILRELAEKKQLTNYMLVLDDPNTYATPDPEDDLRYFLKRKRQAGVDLFTTAHSWMEVPAAFCRFVDFWDIAPASGSPLERKNIFGKSAATNLDKWQKLANADKVIAKREGRYHKFYGVDKFGKHPVTQAVPK